MPRALDLSVLSPQRAALILARREQKRQEYLRRKEILNARSKAWRAANPEIDKAISREWAANNPARKSASRKASYERNRDEVLARQAQRQKELNDAAVKSAFCAKGDGLQSKDVPPELVPILRTKMLINRELRNCNRELQPTRR
jgi:hypothetical protein